MDFSTRAGVAIRPSRLGSSPKPAQNFAIHLLRAELAQPFVTPTALRIGLLTAIGCAILLSSRPGELGVLFVISLPIRSVAVDVLERNYSRSLPRARAPTCRLAAVLQQFKHCPTKILRRRHLIHKQGIEIQVCMVKAFKDSCLAPLHPGRHVHDHAGSGSTAHQPAPQPRSCGRGREGCCICRRSPGFRLRRAHLYAADGWR